MLYKHLNYTNVHVYVRRYFALLHDRSNEVYLFISMCVCVCTYSPNCISKPMASTCRQERRCVMFVHLNYTNMHVHGRTYVALCMMALI